VRKCCLDGEQCLGCGRLMPEILEWASATDERQLQIIDNAKKRFKSRAALFTPRQ
jgi:predicted Fe-S protein YdhL (DUF1289 family)